jgi:anti-sigma factor RsiW
MDSDKYEILSGRGMSCTEIELLVDDYVDGELNEIDSRRFERHTTNCATCGELLRDCRRVVETARRLAERPVPPSVSERLRVRLQQELGLSLATVRGPRLSLIE